MTPWLWRRCPTGGEVPGWARNLRQLTLILATKTGWAEAAILGLPLARLLHYIRDLTPEKQ